MASVIAVHPIWEGRAASDEGLTSSLRSYTQRWKIITDTSDMDAGIVSLYCHNNNLTPKRWDTYVNFTGNYIDLGSYAQSFHWTQPGADFPNVWELEVQYSSKIDTQLAPTLAAQKQGLPGAGAGSKPNESLKPSERYTTVKIASKHIEVPAKWAYHPTDDAGKRVLITNSAGVRFDPPLKLRKRLEIGRAHV